MANEIGIDCGDGIIARPNGSPAATAFMSGFMQAGRDFDATKRHIKSVLFAEGCDYVCTWNGYFKPSPDMETAEFTLPGFADQKPGVMPEVGLKFGVFKDHPRQEDEAYLYEIAKVESRFSAIQCLQLRLLQRTTIQQIERKRDAVKSRINDSVSAPEESARNNFLELIEQKYGEDARKTAEEMKWVFASSETKDLSRCYWHEAKILCAHCLKEWTKSDVVPWEYIYSSRIDRMSIEKERARLFVFDVAAAECPHIRADREMLGGTR